MKPVPPDVTSKPDLTATMLIIIHLAKIKYAFWQFIQQSIESYYSKIEPSIRGFDMKDKMTAIKLSMHTPQYMLDMRNLLGVNTPYYVSSIKNYVQKERDE